METDMTNESVQSVEQSVENSDLENQNQTATKSDEEQINYYDISTKYIKTILDSHIYNQTHAKESLILAAKNAQHKFLCDLKLYPHNIPNQLVFCETYSNSKEDELFKLLSETINFPLIKIRLNPAINSSRHIITELYEKGVYKVRQEADVFKNNLEYAFIHFQDFDDVLITSGETKTPFNIAKIIQNSLVDFLDGNDFFSNDVTTKYMTSIITYNPSKIIENTKTVTGYNKKPSEDVSKRDRLEFLGTSPSLLDRATCFTHLSAPNSEDIKQEIILPNSYFSTQLKLLKDLYKINLLVEPASIDVLANEIVNSGFKRNIVELTDNVLRPYFLSPEDYVKTRKNKAINTKSNLSLDVIKTRLNSNY